MKFGKNKKFLYQKIYKTIKCRGGEREGPNNSAGWGGGGRGQIFFSKKIKRGRGDVYSGSKGRFKTWERKFNPCFKEKPRHKYNLLSISLLVTSKLGM